MMGSLAPEQNALFYDFCLEKHIPSNHLLRRIDQFLDFEPIRDRLNDYYSHTGRPSIDPELMIRMLLVGYCYGIRSERRLCEEVNFNMAYRWFCKLGLEDHVPDHSTFSVNRHGRFRYSDIFRFVFDAIVTHCQDVGLVKGEGFAIDASYIRADVSKKNVQSEPFVWDEDSKYQNRAVKEYLNKLDDHPKLRRPQVSVSRTDPMAQWSAAKGPAEFYYSANYLIDVDYGIILDVEASPSTISLEVDTTRVMIDRVELNHDLLPKRLMGDTAYGTSENLGYLVEEKGIEPHIPVLDKSNRKNGTFSRRHFTWNEEADEYRCPDNKVLLRYRRSYKKVKSGMTAANNIIYRAGVADCKDCPLKAKCCPSTPNRKVTRKKHEKSRDVARAITLTDKYKTISMPDRKKVEMSFAHMKVQQNFTRLRLRGIKSANDEFLLVASAQNLKKLAKYFGRAPPRR